MDANKRKKLIEIGYEIKSCGVCAFGNIAPLTDWGTCDLYTYEHEKHSDSERALSINRHGSCASFTHNKAALAALGSFVEFLP